MADHKSSVSVIIVTYNGIKWINQCLSSIIFSGNITVKIIVIDNGSNDGTIEFIKLNYSDIKLIAMQKNLGFGAANNIGMTLALENNADYVFLLNQDAWLETDTIEKLINIHKTNTDYGILAPIRKISSSAIENHVLQNIVQKNCQQLLSDSLLFKSLKDIYQIDYIGAAAWLISKDCLLKVGGFDPLFFHYGEDNDYAERVLMHDLKIGICPLTFATHDVEHREPNRLRTHRMIKATCLYNIKYKKRKGIRKVIELIYCVAIDLFFERTHFLRSVLSVSCNNGLIGRDYPTFLKKE